MFPFLSVGSYNDRGIKNQDEEAIIISNTGSRRALLLKAGIGVVLLVLAAFLLFFFLSAKETDIQLEIPCVEEKTQEPVVVKISGTYYQYMLRDDHFVGTITVPGYRECTRDYTFKDDIESNFTDEYGQPIGVIKQYNVFESLYITENSYSIRSK